MDLDISHATLPFADACERNKAPILEALQGVLPARGRVLEIGSGTGQHVVHFAPAFPRLSWQPSDCLEHLPGLSARVRLEGAQNILPAIELDVEGAWPDHHWAAAYSSNTAHIMPWRAVRSMFNRVGERLVPAGVFCLYGPFSSAGRHTAASNAEFDQQLRRRDPDMGLRDIEALEALGAENRMALKERRQLPANNQLLVFQMTGAQ
jgi:SAM-dependent methyltransferase